MASHAGRPRWLVTPPACTLGRRTLWPHTQVATSRPVHTLTLLPPVPAGVRHQISQRACDTKSANVRHQISQRQKGEKRDTKQQCDTKSTSLIDTDYRHYASGEPVLVPRRPPFLPSRTVAMSRHDNALAFLEKRRVCGGPEIRHGRATPNQPTDVRHQISQRATPNQPTEKR